MLHEMWSYAPEGVGSDAAVFGQTAARAEWLRLSNSSAKRDPPGRSLAHRQTWWRKRATMVPRDRPSVIWRPRAAGSGGDRDAWRPSGTRLARALTEHEVIELGQMRFALA
jgi:hypothetical protein